MKLAAMPRLTEITFLHERPDRPNDRSPADTQELSDAVQGRIALAGFAVVVVDDGGRHPPFRTGQVVCEVDRFVSDECVRWSGSHVASSDDYRSEPRKRRKGKLLFMFTLLIANARKPEWRQSLDPGLFALLTSHETESLLLPSSAHRHHLGS
jgi:hypothetical protein